MLAESFSSSTLCSLSTSLLTTPITRALAEWSTPVVSRTADTDTTNSEICGPSSILGPMFGCWLLLILVLGPGEEGRDESSDLLFLSKASSKTRWSSFDMWMKYYLQFKLGLCKEACKSDLARFCCSSRVLVAKALRLWNCARLCRYGVGSGLGAGPWPLMFCR